VTSFSAPRAAAAAGSLPAPEQQRMKVYKPEGKVQALYAVCLLNDGEMVTGGADKLLRVFDLETGVVTRVLKGHGDAVTCISKYRDVTTNEVKRKPKPTPIQFQFQLRGLIFFLFLGQDHLGRS